MEEGEGDSTEVLSTVSDLYASVQTQRTKNLDTAVEGEGYANHLWNKLRENSVQLNIPPQDVTLWFVLSSTVVV